jgi:hypothetical protein
VQSSLELARFTEKPAARVTVFVEPEEATAVGPAGIRGYNEWKREWERQAEKPSPLRVPVEWELSSTVTRSRSKHANTRTGRRRSRSSGRRSCTQTSSVAERPVIRVCGIDHGALEGLNPLAGAVERAESPGGAELAVGRLGTLVVDGRDRSARIEVFDVDGKRVEAAWGRIHMELPVGA